ncbi:hypothetical protein [Shimia biformata]|uniref:hypothetical protein n=1 Tax=Shimia biformata TaxID=1294299 RepID=UPI00194FA130|nr:hypothetical protein [Shimia biformata]
MGLKKNTEKLDRYYARLDRDEVDRIKPAHVEEVIRRLLHREEKLLSELDSATKPDKRDRLAAKLKVVREQIDRGNWLLDEVRDT